MLEKRRSSWNVRVYGFRGAFLPDSGNRKSISFKVLRRRFYRFIPHIARIRNPLLADAASAPVGRRA